MMFEILEKNGINNSGTIISYLEKNKIYFSVVHKTPSI